MTTHDTRSTSRMQPREARIAVTAGRLALACALLVAWKVGADVAGALYVADPLKVAARIVADTQSGELIRHVYVTLRLSVIGFAIGCGFGVALPFLLRRVPRLTAAIEPYIMASVGIPKYALVPLFILWFGIDDAPKLVLVAPAGVLSGVHRGVRRHPQCRPPADRHGARRSAPARP